MNIWLIDPHDAIPGETWGYKHGMFLCQTLAQQGHRVTYWTTNFSHATKQFRSHGWHEQTAGENIRILLVPVRAYRDHISVRRLLAYMDYARGLWSRGRTEPAPGCIIATLPIPFADWVVVRLKHHHRTRLISDLRDLWPDLFLTAFPPFLRPLARLTMAPLYWSRAYAFNHSDAVTSVCSSYLQYMRQFAPRTRELPQRIIYSTGVELAKFQALASASHHDHELPRKDPGAVWVSYAGTLGRAYDVVALLEAAALLQQDAGNVRILVAGDGPMRETLLSQIENRGLKNLSYLGVLDMPRLCRLYGLSDIGLSIYAKRSTVAIPAKAFDFYAAGLPVVNSVTGEYAEIIRRERIGAQYEAGDGAALARAIQSLAGRPEERAAMKQRLLSRAAEFDRDRQYGQILELLSSSGEAQASSGSLPAPVETGRINQPL